MIPNKLHFVFGLSETFGGKPWSLCHYLAVKSAIELNNPEKAYLYYKYKYKYWIINYILIIMSIIDKCIKSWCVIFKI